MLGYLAFSLKYTFYIVTFKHQKKKGGKHILLLFKLLHDSKNSMSLLLGKKGGGIKCQMENQKALLGKHF